MKTINRIETNGNKDEKKVKTILGIIIRKFPFFFSIAMLFSCFSSENVFTYLY